MSPRATIGEFETIVLSAVRRQKGNAYGLTIMDDVNSITGREVALGALYTTLERMEKKGLVTSERGEPTAERGGRAKRFFELTPTGQAALNDSLASMNRVIKWNAAVAQ